VTVVEVRRAESRFVTRTDWLTSYHSFSFGDHYDPANLGFGELQAHNEDVVAPLSGYDTHSHRDMDIVTWVLEGSLVHRDSRGTVGELRTGLVQAMSAGTGIRHSERNESRAEPAHFVQMWVAPAEPGLPPRYQQADVGDSLVRPAWTILASGMSHYQGEAAVRITNPHAALLASRLTAGAAVTLPEARYVHLFVVRGAVVLEGAGRLKQGDAVRITAGSGQRITAGGATGGATGIPAGIAADEPAELLVWEMHARPDR
jgi:hypothetical protein